MDVKVVGSMPKTIWAFQNSGWGDLMRGQWQSAPFDGSDKYFRVEKLHVSGGFVGTNEQLVNALLHIASMKSSSVSLKSVALAAADAIMDAKE